MKIANKTFVPESDESRLKGAGGGDADFAGGGDGGEVVFISPFSGRSTLGRLTKLFISIAFRGSQKIPTKRILMLKLSKNKLLQSFFFFNS